MPGAVNFRITIGVFDPNLIPEIQARSKDLSALFNAIIDQWTKNNALKFESARGAEQGGVNFQFGPQWEPLTDEYRTQKQRQGFSDWLMVRTGETMRTLINRSAMVESIEPTRADFGMMDNPEVADRINFNWETRQTMFYSDGDMRAITQLANDFFSMGPSFKDMMFAAAVEKMEMDARFGFTMRES